MKPELCYPLGDNQLCRREDVLRQLKKLAEDLEKYGDSQPICRLTPEHPAEGGDKESSEEICVCEDSARHQKYDRITLDGQTAKPAVVDMMRGVVRWFPPCLRKANYMDSIHCCFKQGDTPEKIEKLVNELKPMKGFIQESMKCPEPSRETSDVLNVTNEKDDEATYMVRGTDVAKGRRHTLKDFCSVPKDNQAQIDENEGYSGNNCSTRPKFFQYYCPEGNPRHYHWSPPRTDCNFPNTCVASCFEHPAVNDWLYPEPGYRYYLQRKDDRQFMPGC